jgi:(1->4)-alpha-D-glucan 1-alpha-D-glucosylmutase
MAPTVRATYRVQLTPEFTFDDAARIVPYLARLGISHLYTSPLAEATPGSNHGYDVTDHQRVRDELGGADGLRRLWEVLAEHGMGQVLDIVPNHMGIRSPSNRWWQDVLANGPESPYASHFDIDWEASDPASRGKVVLPFLDRPLDEAIRDGAVTVERRADTPELVVRHHGDTWPASERSLALLGLSATDCAERFEGSTAELAKDPALLARFLDAQHWRAVHWREASRLLNWRRFFDVTDLASVRVERPEVFADVHQLLRGWLSDDPLAASVVQGVRVDHVDGLVDPEAYLVQLRQLIGPDRLLVVEKILAADEELPDTWPVDGTTGYEVVARINEAMTWGPGAAQLRERYQGVTGHEEGWEAVEAGSRRLVVHSLLSPEATRVASAFVRAAEAVGSAPPLTAPVALDVVRELATEFTVYRTYPRPGGTDLGEGDRRRVDAAVAQVQRRRPDLPARVVELAGELLARRRGAGAPVDDFVTRFNQLSAPLAAKAVEDTAFYRYVPHVWMNEVGGDPSRTDLTTADLHRWFAGVAERWPGTFTPLTTHDTKRGADVRARLSRLAERPHELADAVARWHAVALPDEGRTVGPDPSMEWLLWQIVVGAWPLDVERAQTYATKAMREAKAHTSWLDQVPAYEDAVGAFLERVLTDDTMRAAIDEFVATILSAGRAASLAQLVVAATAVGTPDVYQGDELWNLVLVDPDNRRPVDHDLRERLLAEVEHLDGPGLSELWRTGRDDPDDIGVAKLAVLHRLLALRAGDEAPLTADAPYAPVEVDGPDADAVLAYTRGDVAVVVPRRFMDPSLATVVVPEGTWRDVLSHATVLGGAIPLADLTALFPVAVLVRAA